LVQQEPLWCPPETLLAIETSRTSIRLNGIDCPEKGQAYGKRAKQAASELVFGKEVTLQTYGKDKYGRTIADVLFLMAPTRITRWSKGARAGSRGSMCRGIPHYIVIAGFDSRRETRNVEP